MKPTMKQTMLHIYTRGPLHIGCGSEIGALDNPVVRERISNQPIIPGSSLKGALRAAMQGNEFLDKIFGPELVNEYGSELKVDGISVTAKSGEVIFGDGRLLTLPIRSGKGCFAMVTSPLCLSRYARLLGRSFQLSELQSGACLANDAVKEKNSVILEEYLFECKGEVPSDVTQMIAGLITDPIWETANKRLTLISDEDFSFFCTSAMEISYHNRLKNGVVEPGALFNLECVPSETLFAANITFTDADSEEAFKEFIKENPILQIGGKSTTGRGFCALTLA